MKIVKESINEIRRSETGISSLEIGHVGQVMNLLRGTYRPSSISHSYEMDIKEGDDAYLLHHTIAGDFGSDNPSIIDAVSYNWVLDDKDTSDSIYNKTHETYPWRNHVSKREWGHI